MRKAHILFYIISFVDLEKSCPVLTQGIGNYELAGNSYLIDKFL